eukprot:5454509-Alexandrium_andersonii.AAC.1
MEEEPPGIRPSRTWTGVRCVPFKPIKPSIYTQQVLQGLPEDFHRVQAAKLGFDTESTEVVVALQLPDCM